MDYINTAQVLALGGRIGPRFASLDPIARRTRLSAATRDIDGRTGQSGGLWKQTGKVFTYIVSVPATGMVFLPNKPVLSVGGVSVLRSPMGTVPAVLPVDSVVLSGGCSFEYFVRNASELTTDINVFSTAAFRERDQVTVTYDCGYEPFIASSTVTALASSVARGDTLAVVDDTTGILEGDLIKIGTDILTVSKPGAEHESFGSPAVDPSTSTLFFPYTPAQAAHAVDVPVTQGQSGLPEDIVEAAMKLVQKSYFQDLENPSGAAEVVRGSETISSGARGVYFNIADIEVDNLLAAYRIDIR